MKAALVMLPRRRGTAGERVVASVYFRRGTVLDSIAGCASLIAEPTQDVDAAQLVLEYSNG
jgi:hypothetical protein